MKTLKTIKQRLIRLFYVSLRKKHCLKLIVILGFLIACKPKMPVPIGSTPVPVMINPYKYLPTLTFDGKDFWDTGEKSFPIPFNFNTLQDANNDGSNNMEDNLENYIPFAIGSNITGTGRTGLSNRCPNNQVPAVYFHFVKLPNYDVYEYWFYYADNDWLNDHEHDWEKYFIYEQNNTPVYIKISAHQDFKTLNWNSITTSGSHPHLGVDGGSHAFKSALEDGVQIAFNGAISINNGQLNILSNAVIPWKIYSNDPHVIGVTPYDTTNGTFYYGDPYYLSNPNELGDARNAPWKRPEWSNPPNP